MVSPSTEKNAIAIPKQNMKVTAQAYGQFLVNTPLNVAGTYFEDTASGFAHDRVSDFLKQSKLTSRIIRDKTLSEIPLTPHGFIMFDDTVIDKDFSFGSHTSGTGGLPLGIFSVTVPSNDSFRANIMGKSCS